MYRITSVFALVCLSSVVGIIHRLSASEYSRMPALYELDDYEMCMEQPQAVYCLVKLDLYSKQDNPLLNTIHEYSMDVNRHYNHTNVDRGVCVNTRCRQFLANKDLANELQVDEVLQHCMDDTFQKEHGLNARLAFKYNCDRAGERDEITLADWSFLVVALILILAVFGATIYDRYLKEYNIKDKGHEFIFSFSAERNMNELLQFRIDERMKNLNALHAIRSIINILTLTLHVSFIYGTGFQRQPRNVETSYDHSIGYIFYNGTLMVQMFFFISGFLLTYYIKIYSETQILTWKKTGSFMFKRFIRLTPALGIIIWFNATWLRHLGSGPLWKRFITNAVVADCQKYWWTHLLYINNYVPDNKLCAIQTWQVAADTQLHLLALVLLTATVERGRRTAMIALLLLGTLIPAVQVWLTDLEPMGLITPELFRNLSSESLFVIHIPGHNNMQNYVIGMAAGMFYYNYQRTGKHIYLTKHFTDYKWFYATCHSLTIPASVYFFYLCHVLYEAKTPLLMRIVFAATQRLVIAAITTCNVFGYAFQVPGVIRSIAESRLWQVSSRLTYSVYLIHMSIIIVLIGSRQYTSDIGGFMLVTLYFGVLLLSYALALVFYLVVEAPLKNLLTHLQKGQEKTTKSINGHSYKEK